MLELETHEDIIYTGTNIDDDEKQFDIVIGHIEDMLMDEKFTSMLNAFMEKYWSDFDDDDENKLIYTDIFNEYLETVERYLEDELIRKMPNFTMEMFENDLKNHCNKSDGEVFEMLETFTDFCAFKAMILDYKYVKEGKIADFSVDLSVTKYISDNTLKK